MSAPPLLLATANAGKLQELRDLLPEFTLLSLRDVGIDDLDEPADDYVTNAIAKARDAGKISTERASRLESHLTTRVTAFVNDTKQVLQRLRQGWKRHQQRRPIGSQAQGRGAMQA